MSDCICKIERAENGYEVEVYDSKTAARNGKMNTPWEEPYKSYLFNSSKEVAKFISDNLENFGTENEYDVAFKKASKEAEKP